MDTIVIGIDGSPSAKVAARNAADMANTYQRPLHIVMAVPRVSVVEASSGSERFRISTTDVAEQTLLTLAAELRATIDVPITTAVVVDDPATALCDEARSTKASMIVVGNKRTQGAARMLGSVAGGVLKDSPCSVHVVHTYY